MSKMIGGIIFIYILITLLISFAVGGGGLNSTVLTQPMSPTDTTATVTSTSGFLTADTIIIGNESMTYSSIDYTHFYGLVRTQPSVHLVTAYVYNQQTSLLNDALGFNVNAVASSAGVVSIFTIPLKFFTTTLANIISGSSMVALLPQPWSFIGYFWIAFSAGIVISIGVSLVWILSGLVGKLL